MTRTVVVVDDEEDIREIAVLSLSLAGWEAVPVGRAVDAVDVVARVQPDAVLLDVMMPEQDGPATLNRLRRDARTCGVPIVFLTAKAQVKERQELLAMGAAGVLLKPFDPMRLGQELTALLER